MALTDRQLMTYLKDTLNFKEELDLESELFSTGALDSVSMLNLIAFVEETAGVEIRAEDVTLDNFDTAARILRFAEQSIG
ncbi:acyl carrier protein [Rhizorhapis suberifaciens]|uniref:Acyl carrier protein n=1 Tax=Rhizorhapis suberifaciens TaxID=13656 RepID=A0A840HSJ2_9SPHN|nr:acyl carrier protein [Rhizorhapis suberifaciens]MBB4640965.1 acyl carrier protein [Rhizorhapis suberifaciens]